MTQDQEVNQNPNQEFNIFVNSRPRKVTGPQISFEQILVLAGFTVPPQELGLYDVDWVLGHEAAALTPGHKVTLKNGMRFDAGKSNRS